MGSLYVFFMLPSSPAAATLAVECSYPLRETLPVGILVMGGMVISFSLFLLISLFLIIYLFLIFIFNIYLFYLFILFI